MVELMFSKLDKMQDGSLPISGRGDRLEPWNQPRKPIGVLWTHSEEWRWWVVRKPLRGEIERLNRTIAESKWILGIRPGFDGEGSPGYSKETWERAVSLLRTQWSEFLRDTGET